MARSAALLRLIVLLAVALAVKAQLGESSDEDEGTETVTSCVKCNTNIPTGPGSEVQASKCIAKTIEERDSSYSCFTAQMSGTVKARYGNELRSFAIFFTAKGYIPTGNCDKSEGLRIVKSSSENLDHLIKTYTDLITSNIAEFNVTISNVRCCKTNLCNWSEIKPPYFAPTLPLLFAFPSVAALLLIIMTAAVFIQIGRSKRQRSN